MNEVFNALLRALLRISGALEISHSAIGALLLSCLAFALVCYATLRLERGSTDRYAAIPLSDRVEDPRDEC